MQAIAVVFKIDNGYLVVEEDTHRTVFLKEFSLAALVADPPVDHEAALRTLVMAEDADRKITAIKAVRDYCIKNNVNWYVGLKDAKDYVERIRTDWYYGSVRPHPAWDENG